MSITGRVPLLLLIGIVAVAARPTPSTAWFWVGGVVAAALADVALAAAPRAIYLVRPQVPSTRQDHPTTARLEVANHGPRTAHGVVRDAWQPTAGASDNRHRIRLRTGETTVLETTLLPTRRGLLHAHEVTVRTVGPLGLGCRQRSVPAPGVVRVLPPFRSRSQLPSRLALLRELDGRSAVRTRGQGTEFDSLREYVLGDDVRSIDWRASGRSRAVVVRTWQPERDRRVVLVLDSSRTSATRVGDAPRLDASMEAALLLAALAGKAGDLVDVVGGDARVRVQVRAAGRHGVLPELMEALSGLHPVLVEADWSRLAGTVTRLQRQRSLVVLLTALERSAVEHGLLPVLPQLVARHHVVVASTTDPAMAALAEDRDSPAAVYTAAAAERALADRGRVGDMLRVLGVDVLEALPDDLPGVVADHYLLLKARGLL